MRCTNSLKLAIACTAIFINNQAFAQHDTAVAQFSVLPGLSTNGESAKTTTNHLSFNLFAGVNGGVVGAEFATFANINSKTVKGLQIAGITNIVEADVNAAQISGVFNYNEGKFIGLQTAGIANLSNGDFAGMQVAGIYTMAPQVYGAQIAGITAHAKDLTGLQVSGLASIAHNVKGMQLSGIVNRAHTVEGVQIAGILNTTQKLKGVQIGLLNFASDGKQGVPIGLLSIVNNGYAAVDLSYTDIGFYTLALKTGVDPLYNIFIGASNFNQDNFMWSVGYGFGSRLHINQTAAIEFELTGQQLSKEDFELDLNALGKFSLNLAFDIGGFMGIYAGPTINCYFSQVHNADQNTYGYDIAPQNTFYNQMQTDWYSTTLVQGWVGWQAGIRFFI